MGTGKERKEMEVEQRIDDFEITHFDIHSLRLTASEGIQIA
jgi:hypothetical protein